MPYGDFLSPLSSASHLVPTPSLPPNYNNLSPLVEQDHSGALVSNVSDITAMSLTGSGTGGHTAL